VSRCGSKNWHRKVMCLEEIGLCVQHILAILGSIVNMNWVGRGIYITT